MNCFLNQFLFLFFLSATSYLRGQDEFFLNGSALAIDSCFQLTSAENWQVGSIWNGDKINLNESFGVSFDLFVGCKDDDGADGIVFGLQPISTSIGVGGGDLGFANVEPSLGVEFDTYQNIDYDDPTFDHIAVIRDGDVRHNPQQGTLAGPVQAHITNPNIEDCQYHAVQINWDANVQTLSVYFDCELRITYSGDIVHEIFAGDPLVFWGFTSATGGLNNIQEVCISYTTFLDGLENQIICPGETVQLETSGGVSYQWSPVVGLSDPTIPNPIASPGETTLYTVEILNECGILFYDDVLITVDNDQFEVEIVVEPSSLTEVPLCTEFTVSAAIDPFTNEYYTYSWSSAIGSFFSNPDTSTTLATSSVSQIGSETITVEVTSEAGCTVTSSFNFDITDISFDIPNVFTPNGDGINDTFGVVIKEGFNIEIYNCKVFNRWGEKVFETNTFAEPWDGTFEGQAVTSEVYVYWISFEIAGDRYEEKGDVTLLR